MEIWGTKITSALVGRPYPSDEGLHIICMDWLIRTNSGTSIGEYVEIQKAEGKEAKHVTLSPVTKGRQIYAPGEVLSAVLMNRRVSKGDFISTSSLRRSWEREVL